MNFSERCFMKNYVDQWMLNNFLPRMTHEEIEAMEGGAGPRRCRTIEDALARPGTWPHRWFSTAQQDLEFYDEHEYIYSLWWASYNFSLASYDLIGKRWPRAISGRTVGDVGGSLFSALRLLDHGASKVIVYNLPASSQAKIIRLFVKEYGAPIEVSGHAGDVKAKSESLVMKAYLEHFRDVDTEIDTWIGKGEPFVGDIFTDNSFCEVAYGHYIPIIIDGEPIDDRYRAHTAFEDNMHRRGWVLADSAPNPRSARKRIIRWLPSF